nr:helix-turn-helix transcriptional regulator [uncultured Dyadobacter sp.]
MNSRDQILQKFAEAILEIAKEKNLSLRKLAAASGLEYSQVQRIAKGKVNMALTTIVALCEGLDVPVSTIFKKIEHLSK